MKPSQNYLSLLEEIESLKSSLGISYEIEIVVVTKYSNVEDIIELLKNSPVKHIGENRVQDAEKKFKILSEQGLLSNIKKHMLGPIQSNKLPKIPKLFDVVHSIEDIDIPVGLVKRNFLGELLIEVKTSYEETKHGIPPEEAIELFGKLKEQNIPISGLMTMAPFTDDETEISKCFKKLRETKEKIEKIYNTNLKYLSMGMSNDYKIAIKEGANLLRIGSLIFRK